MKQPTAAKRIAIITGASSGIGSEFARQLSTAADVDELWLIARREDKLHALSTTLQENSTDASARRICCRVLPLDVAGKAGVARFQALIAQEHARTAFIISWFINNAGFGTYGPFAKTALDRQLDMIELNCTALTGLCGVVLPYVAAGSHIINTASLAAFLPLGNFAVYAATKAYALSFSYALAAELKERGISVCALCPGSVSTEFAAVASNGARTDVLHGCSVEPVVRHCLAQARRGSRCAISRLPWKAAAFFSRFIGRSFGAWYSYRFRKRPAHPWHSPQQTEHSSEVSV
ncbi:MAG: SDR family NAD(P)-dependent oxidoreductase [Treponema sp.]|nr:SDR family NAD(P)-dependent oxidoreductase [Treponema sp.]